MRGMRPAPIACLLLLAGCSSWLFSGDERLDRSRPVALVETTGGVEFGATTEFGVLTLGRTATAGPCRVHYFLGPTPVIERGELAAATSTFTRATIDLKTQLLRALDHTPGADDRLVVMWTPDGRTTRALPVSLARAPGITGDVLADPGEELPAGATVLCVGEHGYLFAGLVAGRATLDQGPAQGRYYVFAGVDRVRELLAIPQRHPVDLEPHYRPDDIIVQKPVK